MRSRIFLKMLAAFVVVIAAATLTLDFAIRRSWEQSLYNEIEHSMRQKTQMFAARVQNDHSRPLPQIAKEAGGMADARATIIDSAGVVQADNEADPARMENHATRPEFIEALQGRVGVSSRWSHTVGVDFLYVAVPIPGGAVRLAYPLKAIAETTRQIRRTLLIGSILAVLFAMVIAAVAAHGVTRRLQRIVKFAAQVAAGDLSARLYEPGSDEISRVASALDQTTHKLEESFAAIQAHRRELETLLNSMQEAVIAVDAEGRVQWANQRMERLLLRGVKRDAPLVETVRDPEFLKAIRGATETRELQNSRATSIVAGKTFNVTAAPMPSGGAVAVLHDLTDIERVERTRRDFIANVSHELRTPLTSVQGFAETLLDTSQEPGTREFLEIIRKNASRMTRLTEDLLALARVESGETSFKMQPTRPEELVQDAVQDFRESHPEMTAEVLIESNKLVEADHDALFQVFTNLFDNAAKYAAEGKSVVVGARDVEKGVEFFVRDFGPGIASEHLSRLFERFYRVDKARSRESGGTGLGLAIAKHIVLAHGGSIRAESELNHGSTFFFVLPEALTAARV